MKGYLYILLTLIVLTSKGQNLPNAEFNELRTNLWVGSYNKFRVAENWIWDAQHHYRRGSYNNVPYVGRMEQFYNRHAITYLYSKSIFITAGAVLRLNYTPQPGNPNFEKVVLEPRFWHEYMFVMPQPRFMLYHRVRIEHRWSRSNAVNADWIYRNRWRYKIYAAIPINKPKLVPGAYYFVPDIEIIMQSGKVVVGSPLEDVRIYPQIGYIVNPRVKVGGGMMYTMGQTLSNASVYNHRWVLRVNCYLSLDFRKFESKLPPTNLSD